MPDEKLIPPFLYAYYLDGYSARDAHQKMLTKLGRAFQLFTLKQVKEQYEKFRSREFTMGDPPPTSTSILECLKHRIVCEKLVCHLGLSDILTIRKVCKSFLKATTQYKTHINKVAIRSDWFSYDIIADDFHVKYEKVTDGFVVSESDRHQVHFIKDDLPLTMIVHRDLSLILGNPNITFSELKLKGFEVDTFMVVKAFGQTERGNRRPIKLRKITVAGVVPLKIILPSLVPRELEVIKVVQLLKDVVNPACKWLYSRPQWKMAKIFITDQSWCAFNLVEDFGHFDYMDYVVSKKNMVNWTDLVKLKDHLLQRSTFQKFEVIPHKTHSTTDTLFKTRPISFIPFQDVVHEMRRWYHFPYPDSKDQKISIQISKDHILFKGPAFTENKITIVQRRKS